MKLHDDRMGTSSSHDRCESLAKEKSAKDGFDVTRSKSCRGRHSAVILIGCRLGVKVLRPGEFGASEMMEWKAKL